MNVHEFVFLKYTLQRSDVLEENPGPRNGVWGKVPLRVRAFSV